MPNDAKKSPKPQKSGKKLNAINSVPPTNAEGKKQISEKTRNEKIATKNKY